MFFCAFVVILSVLVESNLYFGALCFALVSPDLFLRVIYGLLINMYDDDASMVASFSSGFLSTMPEIYHRAKSPYIMSNYLVKVH